VKYIAVGKGLETRGLPNREVTYFAIIQNHHVLTTWNAVIARLLGLCREIKRASSVAYILAGPRLVAMVVEEYGFIIRS
jgi:hypothetical protein